MASNLRRSKRTIGRRLSYVESKLNVARRVNVPRRLGPGAVSAPSLAPDVNSTIQGIQTTADGKNTIYRQSSAPTGGTYAEGDLWFDTSQNNRLNRYVSGSWVAFTLGDNALASISANKITAGTIDASVINVSNLNAGNIVTGILSSIEMQSGTPVGGLYPFRVGTDGSFRATNATLSGTITSTNGKIGAFNIGTDALSAATFAVLPFDTASSMSIGSQGQIFGRVDVGSFWGTPFYTETIMNASDGSGIIVRGDASGGYLETRIRSSFISTNQVFLPGGSVQTQLNGKASSTHNHDGTYSSTSHTHAYIPTSGITQDGTVAIENTNTGTNANGQPLQLTRRLNSSVGPSGTTFGDNFIQFVRASGNNWTSAVVAAIEFTSALGVGINNASDARMKENVVSIENALDTVDKIRPVSFSWKEHGDRREDGFIAQELYEVYPNAVSVGSEDVNERPWGVYYGSFTPLLTAAIKELLQKVRNLEDKIAELESM